MRTITAQEIKRRGIKAVDPLIAQGAVQVIAHNQPAYVVMDMARYLDLIEEAEAGYVARVLAAEREIAEGKATRYTDVAALIADMDAIEIEEDDEKVT